MEETRVDRALARLDAAMARIAAAHSNTPQKTSDSASSARIMKLVNNHEKLREEVAEALGELDSVIAALEGGEAA
jgi:hypothetical protein